VRAVGWGLFVAWAVHDTEEVLTATWWSRRTLPRLRAEGWPDRLVERLATTTPQFAVAAAVVGVAVLLAAWHGARTNGRSPLFQAAVLVFGWHGVVHVAQAVLVRGYVPGLAGAVFVVVPYAVWAWRTTPAPRPGGWVVAGTAAAAIGLTVAGQALGSVVA